MSQWPPGIFRRAFIRAYAEAIGLDSDATMRQFIVEFPDHDDGQSDGLPTGEQPASQNSNSAEGITPFRRRAVAVFVDVAILAMAGIALAAVLDGSRSAFALVTIVYYSASVMLSGNTPGGHLSRTF
jgi:cytoskeletal protein RodZ